MKKLNTYLANLAFGNVKLHNLHWNLEGSQFKQVHEYLEVLYDEGFAYLDEVAELLKMQGITPLSSMKEYVAETTLSDLEQRSFTDREAIELALEYVKEMNEFALDVRKAADEEGNFYVANMMEDHSTAYLKHKWFLSSMLKNLK
ncbi:DNA starvation/stationary phase protection protein [Helcococcus ovis]|uniref:DNA starvation/stationary phase protection protein n=1 Tax=Helcococcus ovis TaxID=72026 RepID=A0A4R9C1Q7_9FIRM|nr:DNA starvation/stationary phase protection protein [Helcococcus ovis]TFF64770.1 DNA starvation/stationary phase protection protein [Helcococcus ovis]TFF66639.1 DNA starvation/stationary phase protection protein [Helcococcus ovis]TFF68014.1 DNA starvation/stationary phase protection protein [Helcococcus ovis]WNZ01125.1 DNA starvation/stationary phase protection protein [Helcococcus ovis]